MHPLAEFGLNDHREDAPHFIVIGNSRDFSGDPDVTDWKKNTNYKSGYGPTHQVKSNLMK